MAKKTSKGDVRRLMSEEEKEVLKTFKSGLGLTGAEREILANYIDKQQKVINLMAESWKQDDIRSVEQIKEYFYKEVEEENE